MKFIARFLLTAILSILAALGQSRKSAKIAPELTALDPGQTVDVIIQYKEQPADFHRSFASRRGATLIPLDIINSHPYRIPAGQLADLADDPAVEFIHNYDIFTIGAGYLNADAALGSSSVLSASLSAISPAATFNSSTGAATLVTGSSVIRGSPVTWGNSVIWGSSALSGNSVIWGSNAASANSVIRGSSVSVSWGGSAPSADSLILNLLGEK